MFPADLYPNRFLFSLRSIFFYSGVHGKTDRSVCGDRAGSNNEVTLKVTLLRSSTVSAPRKTQIGQSVEIRPRERMAITLEENFAFMEATK